MSGLPRVVVRKSLRSIVVQCIEYAPQGDRVIASATAFELKELGWKSSLSNTSAAYLTGLLAGSRAAKKGMEKAVLDIGMQSPSKGSKVFASLKGLLDAGIEIPHGGEVIPSNERLRGKDEAMFNDVRGKLGVKETVDVADKGKAEKARVGKDRASDERPEREKSEEAKRAEKGEKGEKRMTDKKGRKDTTGGN